MDRQKVRNKTHTGKMLLWVLWLKNSLFVICLRFLNSFSRSGCDQVTDSRFGLSFNSFSFFLQQSLKSHLKSKSKFKAAVP